MELSKSGIWAAMIKYGRRRHMKTLSRACVGPLTENCCLVPQTKPSNSGIHMNRAQLLRAPTSDKVHSPQSRTTDTSPLLPRPRVPSQSTISLVQPLGRLKCCGGRLRQTPSLPSLSTRQKPRSLDPPLWTEPLSCMTSEHRLPCQRRCYDLPPMPCLGIRWKPSTLR